MVTEQGLLAKAQERPRAWALADQAGASEPAKAEVEVREGAEVKVAVALTATVAAGKALRTKRRTSDNTPAICAGERRPKMPRGDGSGPMGMGPMTGRGAGYCAGYSVPGFMNPVPGQGLGRGFGRGFGRGWGRGGGRGMGWGRGGGAYGVPAAPYPYAAPYPEPTPADERALLEDQMGFLKEQLEGIKQRLDELAKEEKK